ncbi:hydrogenase subunit MbhD domain-containing protein [Pyrococcus horikoshii]|uniref:MrpA C-terminal/MbhD domain-containing protein n=2 Tax=Pyrococcus horikoshii TaxID=53953 RepID=O58673_PYRHO|nr:hydrogenase subunit MbhD domain-containing protein [Pyrococcus horikoshii]BAA30040.1 162aa long hypothetical protein [Pyrococcus horikoshii OT3]HII61205.1 DUF4040 domain-containing protein [Pyrococcus horikoshii]
MLGIILEVVMLTLALIVILHRDFMTSLIVYSLTSLVFILLVLLSYAPDVALSGIVVGGIVTGLFVFGYERAGGECKVKLPLGLAVLPLAFALLRVKFKVNLASYEAYVKAWNINNLVSEILAGWRLYDSVGEALILFSAALGFSLLMGGRKRENELNSENHE